MATLFNPFSTLKKEGRPDTHGKDEKSDRKGKHCVIPLI